jgi:ABC-type amino acid transport substrate-binding protein
MLIFVPFAAWFSGESLHVTRFVSFALTGLLSAFGSLNSAIPFLLNYFRIPEDLNQLFVAAGVLTFRFSTMGAVMHMMAVSLLAACATMGALRIRRTDWLGPAILCVTGLLVLVMGVRAGLGSFLQGSYYKDQIITHMQLVSKPVASVVSSSAVELRPPRPTNVHRIDFIRKEGVLRIGFNGNRLPWSYFNANGNLVGFDIDMAHQLAGDLAVRLEFIPIDLGTLASCLQNNAVDLVMGGIVSTPNLFSKVTVTNSYLDVTPAVVMPDYEKHRYENIDQLRKQHGLRIGVADSYFAKRMEDAAPNLEPVLIRSVGQIREFFEGKGRDYDALIMSAEAGSAWTLLYPKFAVIALGSGKTSLPLVYPVAANDDQFARFLSNWVEFKKRDGTIDRLRDHWLFGKDSTVQGSRWSIARDVLHWVR